MIAIKPTRVFTDAQLANARLQGDPPADAVLAAVAAQGHHAAVGQLMRWLGDTTSFDTTGQPEAVRQFFVDHAHLPTWADRARMQRGMAFFQQHAGAIGLALGTLSLPYTYLGANGIQLLWLTERIKTDTPRRLQETGEWVFAVNDPKNWLSSRAGTGTPKAITYTLKIRLIHAAARWYAYQANTNGVPRWDEAWGVPVCQEDMVGTMGAFSYIVLRGLRKMGVSMTEADEEDYLHHINVIGFINGVSDELLPRNLREAFHLDKLIARRQFGPSEAGRGLTKALLDAITTLSGKPSARNLAAAQMRFFLGTDHADALGIPNVPVEESLMGIVNRLPIFPKLIPKTV
ncbi:oxygenase MpaB family protein [Fibrella sp. WM1]|uniref:oxygenase MpaB family protein n=1 Tax=Fibrella musci TaxID=3242485 RepID=UPI003521DA7F